MNDRVHDDLARWLAAAVADAESRGRPELRPLLEGLAQATATLRRADWNDRADAAAHPESLTADVASPRDPSESR